MANRLSELLLTTPVIARCADIFAKRLPQSMGARMENKSVVLSFIVDDTAPTDRDVYGRRHIDPYAIAAFREIFSGEDEIDLLLLDIRLVFSVLFWDGSQITGVEFNYYMTDLIYLAGSKN